VKRHIIENMQKISLSPDEDKPRWKPTDLQMRLGGATPGAAEAFDAVGAKIKSFRNKALSYLNGKLFGNPTPLNSRINQWIRPIQGKTASINKNFKLIFYENRSTPQVVKGDEEPKAKTGYGEIVGKRDATKKEADIIRKGRWLRKDEQDNDPKSKDYKFTKMRQHLTLKRKEKLQEGSNPTVLFSKEGEAKDGMTKNAFTLIEALLAMSAAGIAGSAIPEVSKELYRRKNESKVPTSLFGVNKKIFESNLKNEESKGKAMAVTTIAGVPATIMSGLGAESLARKISPGSFDSSNLVVSVLPSGQKMLSPQKVPGARTLMGSVMRNSGRAGMLLAALGIGGGMYGINKHYNSNRTSYKWPL
jgi:hypothetical protein